MAKVCAMRARAELAEARACTVRPNLFLIEGAQSYYYRSHEEAVFRHIIDALSYREAARGYRESADRIQADDERRAARDADWAKFAAEHEIRMASLRAY